MKLPILHAMVPDGFDYGTMLLVEFEPHSLWYETAFTIAAQALRNEVVTDYHSFQHPPNDVRQALNRMGVDAKKMEESGMFVVIDSHTVQTGLGVLEEREPYAYLSRSLKISDWSIGAAQVIRGGAVKHRLHIDDNVSVLSRYNQENAILDFYRTRIFPGARTAGYAFLNSLVTGVHSEAFYSQFEALSDGVIDFKSQESSGQMEHLARVRVLRGKPFDSRWRRLQLLQTGEVALSE